MSVEVLPASSVRVGASASDRDAAIDLVGAMLVDSGCVTRDYVAEMRARELIVSTYLGNGIALPHGTNEGRTAVLRTGLAVVQFPNGVAWGEESAYVVIGLAALAEEHIGVLSRLATILGDEVLCQRLAVTTDANEIYQTLSQPDGEPAAGHDPPIRPDEIVRRLTITNPHGLHARPAAAVVARARAFEARVILEANGRRADARSITGLLGLGAAVGDDVRITALGGDASQAVEAVSAILTSTSET
ncbi:MAG TPA: HPr family phosphocarrier protein [Candidatus Limnocylindria bacterium]|nr:HPr family phosphocarrier protein [Candidatus Limnocylindria bacterium]